MTPRNFVWYDLVTSDKAAAQAFYGKVIGWGTQDVSQPGMPYIIFTNGPAMAAGLMDMPSDMSGTPPFWMGYVHVDDVDAAAIKLTSLGGAVHNEPQDIPGVGRFAVVADPQGAGFILFKPIMPENPPPQPAQNAIGHVGWHELYATNWEKAFDFYNAMFGWTKDTAVDMGPAGTYQLFAAGGPAIGGMMNKMPDMSVPAWGFYFNVDGTDAAVARVKEAGGEVLNGPHQVPGGSWIAQCADPQGAMFAVVSQTR